jgi:hypothetical protein
MTAATLTRLALAASGLFSVVLELRTDLDVATPLFLVAGRGESGLTFSVAFASSKK